MAPTASPRDVAFHSADICVAGAGLAGLTAALACARRGLEVAVVAPSNGTADLRTTALLAQSTAFLAELGVWDKIAPLAQPLKVMRIIDDTGRLFRSPQVDFRAAEIGLPAFGHNVANRILAKELHAELGQLANVRFVEGFVAGADFSTSGATVFLKGGGGISCRLAVAADGRNSALRQAKGIAVRDWQYPQAALVVDFGHELPHEDTSTEFHTRSGPFTIVPSRPQTCGLVWVARRHDGEALAKMDAGALARAIEKRMHSMLGRIEITSPVQQFALSGMVAASFGEGPLVLVGEAAHVVAPIGAQGFNLGIRDVELLHRLCEKPEGLAGVGRTYHLRRIADIGLRTASIDLMNRSLLTGFLPVQIGRSLALWTLGAFGPLRRMAMREGIAPGSQIRHLREVWSAKPVNG